MEIYVVPQQLVLVGKVKDLPGHLRELAQAYYTIEELIQARLH